MVHVDVDGLKDIDVDVDLDGSDLAELHEKLQNSFDEAQEAYEKAMEQFHEAWAQMMVQRNAQGGGQNAAPDLNRFNFMIPPPPGAMAPIGKARQSFQVKPDGTIEVHIRKGDSEVVQMYSNESDLQRRDAKLYEKYREVMADDND
jgi:hypothetical protein